MRRGWRELHNEELHKLYTYVIIMRTKEDEMGKACIMLGENRIAYKILLGKHKRKRN
jgi:hypothetical protein